MYGVVFDNRENPPDSSYELAKEARANVVVLRWTEHAKHMRNVYARLSTDLNDPYFVVQVGWSRVFSADEWLAAVREAKKQLPPNARAIYKLGNEPNNDAEGKWTPEQYGQLVRTIGQQYHEPFIVAGPSHGYPDWANWFHQMVQSAGGELPANAAIGVQVYAHLVPDFTAYHQYNKPLCVTEFSIADESGETRANWILNAYEFFTSQGAQFACQFICAGDSFGQWPQSYVMGSDEAKKIGRRSENQAGEAPAVDTSDPLSGKLLFVWEASTHPDELIAKCKEFGCDPDIKIADGSYVWDRITPEYVQTLRDAGLKPRFWAYVRSDLGEADDNRGGGHPEEEAAAIIEQSKRLGFDFVTLDYEIEVEGHADMAAILLEKLDETGISYAVCTWTEPVYHSEYPWDLFKTKVRKWRPMMYDDAATLENLENLFQFVSRYDVQIYPAYGTNNPSALVPGRKLLETMFHADKNNLRGESYWRYGATEDVDAYGIDFSQLIKLRRF